MSMTRFKSEFIAQAFCEALDDDRNLIVQVAHSMLTLAQLTSPDSSAESLPASSQSRPSHDAHAPEPAPDNPEQL